MLSNSISTLRFWGLVIVRAISLVMLTYGAICFLLGIGVGIATYSGLQGLYNGWFLLYGPDNWSWLWFGLAMMIPGATIMVLSRHIVRWVIPVPVQECPNCGYELKNLKSPTCPECGFAIGSA